MIVIDTSALVDSLCMPRRSLAALEMLVASHEEIVLSSLVLYEWLRGPRTRQEILDQEKFLPRDQAIPFGAREAAHAADLYKQVTRARSREIDLAIAATAIARNAPLWTLNPEDFKDIPNLKLV